MIETCSSTIGISGMEFSSLARYVPRVTQPLILDETQGTNANQWPRLILSSSTTGLLIPLRPFSDTGTKSHVTVQKC